MSTDLAIPDLGDLTTWGDRKLNNAIGKGHTAAGSHKAAYEQYATLTGVLLIERKARLAHGEWLPWLAENFDGSQPTASTYMRLASEWLTNQKATSSLETANEASQFDVQSPAEVIEDAEVVEDIEVLDAPVMHLPDVMSESAGSNLRTQAVHWYEQGRRVRTLLDSGEIALSKSDVDMGALERDADLMIEVANRLKGAIRNAQA